MRPFAPGIPVITELHSLQPLVWYKEVLSQISYRWSNKIVVLSDAAKKYLNIEKGLADNKIAIIRNGVDYNNFCASESLQSNLINFGTGPKIGYLGTFYRWQGIFELLESAEFVLNKIPDALFIFIGDGPEKESLKKRACEISEKSIRVLDQVPPYEVPHYVSALNLFCMLRPRSRATELTLPLKILEVGMAKTPLLVSDLPGLLEAGGKSPQEFFNIQSDLSPHAVADCIVSLLSEVNEPLLARKAQAYYEYLKQADVTWRKSAEILKDTYWGLLDKQR